ncbi:MAG: LptF/LptG family permease [Terriglobia bacterium]
MTLARRAVAVSEPEKGRLNLRLLDGSTHSYGEHSEAEYSVSTCAESVLAVPLPGSEAALGVRRHAGMSLGELWAASRQGPRWRNARADFHRRLVLPVACLVFGLLALPLAMLAGRSGRSVGFIAAVTVAVGYYFLFLFGDRLGREGRLWPGLGVWLPNLVLLALALWFLHGQRRVGAGEWADLGARLGDWCLAWIRRLAGLRGAFDPNAQRGGRSAPSGATPIGERLPRTLDLYVLRGFFFHLFFLLGGLLLVFALFSVLELTDEIAAHGIGWPVVARFLWYLLPQALYWMAPLAILLALMVELALLSKRNELVAIKGAGISLYRIAVPVLLLALGASCLLFWLDYDYLPYANQRQQALRNQIKGRPPQATLRDRHWILGEQDRIYYYHFFDRERSLLGGLDVFEVDPEPFTLKRRLHAEQASWDPQAQVWVLEAGWSRSFGGQQAIEYNEFTSNSFAQLSEPPAYFQQELRQSQQMNWLELHFYISELQHSGFDVTQLRVQFHKKFAFPLIGTVMVLLAFPFGPRWGHRGAVGGLAVGIALGFTYWVLMSLFESVGNLGLLPPPLAAWGPNLVFVFAGSYLFLQVDT